MESPGTFVAAWVGCSDLQPRSRSLWRSPRSARDSNASLGSRQTTLRIDDVSEGLRAISGGLLPEEQSLRELRESWEWPVGGARSLPGVGMPGSVDRRHLRVIARFGPFARGSERFWSSRRDMLISEQMQLLRCFTPLGVRASWPCRTKLPPIKQTLALRVCPVHS